MENRPKLLRSQAHALATARSVLIWITFASPFACIAIGLSHPDADLAFAFPLFLFTFIFAFMSSFVSERLLRSAQDIEARDIVASIRAGNKPSFCLVLRSYKSIGSIKEVYLHSFGGLGGGAGGGGMNLIHNPSFDRSPPTRQETIVRLEDRIDDVSRHLLPTVSVAPDSVVPGGGRVPLGEFTWREYVQLLSHSASIILLVPGVTDGIIWEINLVAKNYINKTVFVIPGLDLINDFSEEVKTLSGVLESHHLKMPKHDPAHSYLFMFDIPNDKLHWVQLHLRSQASLSSALKSFQTLIEPRT